MSYNQAMKRHMLNLLHTDCRHQSMSDAMRCNKCGVKFMHAVGEYERLKHQFADEFVRTGSEVKNRELENMEDAFAHRVQNDSMYREHIRLLAHGTPQEKARELKREFSGYYEKHAGDSRILHL
jgi:hypothetical protein